MQFYNLVPRKLRYFFLAKGGGGLIYSLMKPAAAVGLHRIAGAHVFLLPLEHTEQKF